MGRGIPAALLGRKQKKGAHSNRKDAGVDHVAEARAKAAAAKAAPKAAAPKAAAPKPAAAPEAAPEAAAKPEVSMNNTKAELIAAADSLGIDTSGMTKAQILDAINAA